MLLSAVEDHQPGVIPLRTGMLGNPGLGQILIEVFQIHRWGCRPFPEASGTGKS